MTEYTKKIKRVVITEEQIAEAVEEQMRNLTAQLARQGLSLEMYCGFMSTTEEALRQDARAAAIQSIRMRAAVEEITRLEKLEATPKDIAEALALVCRQNNMTMEQLKPYYNAEFEQAIITSVLTSKVMRLIREASDIAES